MSENNNEKLYEYELIQYEGFSYPRKYRVYRLTESEAHDKNQGYAFNRVPKRLVRADSRTK
jgi:hypothetical protein